MLLLLVRHGESTNNELFRLAGLDAHAPSAALELPGRVADPELSARGREQAAESARRLRAYELLGPVRLVASPTARAVQTAAEIARHLALPTMSVDPRWVEGGGIYEWNQGVRVPVPGRPIEELERLAGLPVTTIGPTGWDGGFEEFDEIPARAGQVVGEQRRLLGTTIAVTHEFFTQFLIRAAMELPYSAEAVARASFGMPNGGIAQLELARRTTRLERLI